MLSFVIHLLRNVEFVQKQEGVINHLIVEVGITYFFHNYLNFTRLVMNIL